MATLKTASGFSMYISFHEACKDQQYWLICRYLYTSLCFASSFFPMACRTLQLPSDAEIIPTLSRLCSDIFAISIARHFNVTSLGQMKVSFCRILIPAKRCNTHQALPYFLTPHIRSPYQEFQAIKWALYSPALGCAFLPETQASRSAKHGNHHRRNGSVPKMALCTWPSALAC